MCASKHFREEIFRNIAKSICDLHAVSHPDGKCNVRSIDNDNNSVSYLLVHSVYTIKYVQTN